MPGEPVGKSLVLVGGGHAHVHVLRTFGRKPLAGVRLTLVTRDLETPYSGMLPGLVAGIYTRDESHIDLRRLARFAGAELIHATAAGLDPGAKTLLCAGRPPVPYDIVSLDTGAGPSLALPGAAAAGIPIKPVDTFLLRWDAILAETRRTGRPPRIVIVGGGAGGVELALAMEHRLRRLAGGRPAFADRLCIVTRRDIVPSFPRRGREMLREELKRRGIAVFTGAEIVEARPGSLLCAGGATLPFDEAVWVTGAAAPPWLRDSGLALDEKGFVALQPALRSINDPHVFAAGDVATVLEHPRPKAGVFAVRQGGPLAGNLRRALGGEPLKPFTPQRRFLVLLGTSEGEAVATRGGWAAEGAWAWRLKQWIDRRWIRQYQNVPS
jgi:selenide, water dikinase